MRVGAYDVFNSNASKTIKPVVRVKLAGVILAEVRSEHSNPLRYLRTRPQSDERKSLVEQLKINLVSDEDIQMILQLPPEQAK